MAAFTGQLTQNEIYSALYNMIISQEVFADRISDMNELVDKAKSDGSLYGDTKLFYAAAPLHSAAWGNDAEAVNLLDIARPDAPECQAIRLDQFRIIALTLDDYLSKRGWSDEFAFGQFNSVMESYIQTTKRIYDVTLYNCFFGNAESSTGAQQDKVILTVSDTPETRAKKIAEKVANIAVEMTDVSRKYNDYGQVTKFSADQLMIVWNSRYINEIRKVDTPAIFHKDGLIDKFADNVLQAKYFGRAIDESTDAAASGKMINSSTGAYDATKGVIRTKVEKSVTVSSKTYDLYPGEQIPTGAIIKVTGVSTADFTKDEVYVEDASIVCKIVVKLPPMMSAFEVGTSFWNARSLTMNRYLIWGYNSLEYLKAYPIVTLREAAS